MCLWKQTNLLNLLFLLFSIIKIANFRYSSKLQRRTIISPARVQCYVTFLRPQFTKVPNKLACLSLEGLPSLVYSLWVRIGAFPRIRHLKGAPLLKALSLNCKHYTLLERLPKDKQSSLLWTFINYGRKMFCNIGPRSKWFAL